MPAKKKNTNNQVTPEGARTTGKGYLTVQLLSMAVKFYKSTDEFSPGFHMIHQPCNSRIQEKVFCPKCNKTIENKQIELCKGFEVGDKIVQFNDSELEDVRAEASKMFSVEGFITIDESKGYIRSGDRKFVGADPEHPCDAYRVMFTSLVDSGLVGIVHYAQRGFERQALLTADRALNVFILEDVLYADQIRSASSIPRPSTYEVGKEELDLCKRLIKSMLVKPEAIGNSPNKIRLQAFIDKKIAQASGSPVDAPLPLDETPRTAVDDLFARLKASLEANEKKAA